MFIRTFTIILAAVAVAAASWAADVAVGYNGTPAAPVGPPTVAEPGTDATMELKWDDGSVRNYWAWYTGTNAWNVQEFDISTIASYNYIEYITVQLSYHGGRVGIYDFSGGSPGSLLWGPSSNGSSGRFTVGWSLGEVQRFGAAWNQYSNYPNCPYWAVAGGTTAHAWYYYNGWSHGSGQFGGTFMIRAVVDDEHNAAVAPSSLGRVKALYF